MHFSTHLTSTYIYLNKNHIKQLLFILWTMSLWLNSINVGWVSRMLPLKGIAFTSSIDWLCFTDRIAWNVSLPFVCMKCFWCCFIRFCWVKSISKTPRDIRINKVNIYKWCFIRLCWPIVNDKNVYYMFVFIISNE